MRLLLIACLATLACMPGLASTEVLAPQGAFQMDDSEWELAKEPLSAYQAHQQHLETVRALPNCATLRPPYDIDLRCQLPSRCVVPSTSISVGCLHLRHPSGIGWKHYTLSDSAAYFQVPDVPLVPPQVLPASLSFNGQHEPTYIMVQADTTAQGQERLTTWRSALDSGQPICRDGRCWAFRVMTGGNGPADGREVIAACPVVRVQSIAVPVNRCTVVAVTVGDRVLVRAIVGWSLVLYYAGRPDLEIRLRRTVSASAGFAEVIGAALRAPPMNLIVDHVTAESGSISVYGIANFRPSPFLPGWREIITVHVHGMAGRRPGQGETDYSVLVSITAYISKQATRRSQDYRLPEQSQQDLYNAQIGSALARQLGGLVKTMRPSAEPKPGTAAPDTDKVAPAPTVRPLRALQM